MTQVILEHAPHLGGYVRGGDEATMYPFLWKWLVEGRGVKSILDVGCGDGAALSFFRDLGCFVRGVDGVPQDDPDIIEHDFTTGIADTGKLRLPHPVQLVWCCEFVEHVEEKYVPNFVETFRHAPLVMLTHAEPGQAGHHHVNCRTPDYWAGVMASIGYLLNVELTTTARALARTNVSTWNHFARSGLAFERS